MKTLRSPSKLYRIFYLFKMTFMHKGIAERRFIREIIRKWRFATFVKVMAKRKLELMYKNLHVSYLQMANEVFGDEESTNASVVKEFERFGTDVGMWGNEDPNIPTESGYVKSVNKKYVFETLENERKLYDEIELKKKVVVGEVVKGESKVVEGDIKSEESGSESSRRRKRETKDKVTKEDVKEKKDEESNASGRRIRTYNRKKAEENKEETNEEKRGTHKIYRRVEK